MNVPFVGRKHELSRLNDIQVLGRSSVVVISGRRRIGKSRLVEEFAKDKRFLSFIGLAPIDSMTAQDQRNEFSKQLAMNVGIPYQEFTDWTDAFNCLASNLTDTPIVVLFDEISWMGSDDHTFVAKLKNWWDRTLQYKSNFMLIFCGSVSTWIEKNIIKSTAFFGRITLQLDLKPLSIPEAANFLEAVGFKGSIYDKFTILAVTGGVPWYLEKIVSHKSANENIKHLCFESKGLLTKEFDSIFHDLFNGNSSIYKRIIYLLASGMKSFDELKKGLVASDIDLLDDAVQNLVIAGFVSQHYTWSILNEKKSMEQSLYRLSDNYLRFYIKYIEPNMADINMDNFQKLSVRDLPGWDGIMGLQIENLLLNNRSLLLNSLGIHPMEVVADNPYIQQATASQRGCQIDYLVQTRTKTLFVCEFKSSRSELEMEIIESMEKKIQRFSVPLRYGVVPVLFHLSGVARSVYLENYFYRIIDIADFLRA